MSTREKMLEILNNIGEIVDEPTIHRLHANEALTSIITLLKEEVVQERNLESKIKEFRAGKNHLNHQIAERLYGWNNCIDQTLANLEGLSK